MKPYPFPQSYLHRSCPSAEGTLKGRHRAGLNVELFPSSCPVPSLPFPSSLPITYWHVLSCPFPSLPIPSHPFLARPVPSHAVPSCPLSFRKMDLIDNSFFDKQFKPRLEDKFLKIEHPLPDVEAIQAKSWVEVLAETDESLQKRSSSNRSIRRRARYFARKVYSKSAELFLLCSLSYSIYGLPKIPPGPFYKQLEEWWASCPPQKPLALATETICRDLPPHDDKSENSPTSASVKKSIELPPEATSRQFLPTSEAVLQNSGPRFC